MWQQSFIAVAVPVTMMLTIGALSFILLKAYDLADRINGDVNKRRYRIAIVETKSALGDDVTWYAIQKRSSLFWWVTMGYANDIVTARVLVRSIMKRPAEKVIKVVSLEKKARKAK